MKPTEPSLLVVDDDQDTCRNLSDLFTDLGYRVDTAQDGDSALEKVRQHSYDVALIDLRMPGTDGLTVCRELRKLRAPPVAMIVTGYAGNDLAEQAEVVGVSHVLSKPVDFPRLLALVDETLAQPLVLVVDDDPDLCLSLRDILRERGYRVWIAHDEAAAALALQDASFRVVVIDMRLPHSNGGRVFRLVRQADAQTRTVLITGYRAEMEQALARLLAEGADAACYKPFDVGQLLDTLQRLCGA
jgi:CheY-like chemotaxis protein